jgi:hypothetical protein
VRDFRILWWGFMGSWMAMQMQQVARGYLAYKLTGSAIALGMVTLAMGLPRIVLSPIGGDLADRFSKRDVLLWTQAALGLIALFQAVLLAAHLMTIEWLVAAGFMQGAAFSFNMPVRQAYLPQVVGKGDALANAIALNNAGMNFTLGVMFGVMLLGFALGAHLRLLVPALVCLFFTGTAGDAYMALNSTLIMMTTDESVYGRVMGVYMMAQSIRPITVLPISAVADAIGTAITELYSGGIVAVFVLGVAPLSRSAPAVSERRRERLPGWLWPAWGDANLGIVLASRFAMSAARAIAGW